jgi:hypothetical protein
MSESSDTGDRGDETSPSVRVRRRRRRVLIAAGVVVAILVVVGVVTSLTPWPSAS